MGSCVRSNDSAGLYEIPITSPLLPSRKPMRPVALQPGKTRKPFTGSRLTTRRNIPMLALALGFFVAGIGYAYACERL